MKSILVVASVVVLLSIGNLPAECIAETELARGIQIISPVNHTFLLELNELKQILEADAIKDRYVVVVSIAGAFRQGKSFLLNFYIRYLEAQVNASKI